jgi:hypothetical protein
MLTNRLHKILERIGTLYKQVERETQEIECELRFAHDLWPDAQVVKGADWKSREIRMPPNRYVWASDGKGVWLIHSGDGVVPDSAIAVRYWTEAFIPAPPDDTPPSSGEMNLAE